MHFRNSLNHEIASQPYGFPTFRWCSFVNGMSDYLQCYAVLVSLPKNQDAPKNLISELWTDVSNLSLLVYQTNVKLQFRVPLTGEQGSGTMDWIVHLDFSIPSSA